MASGSTSLCLTPACVLYAGNVLVSPLWPCLLLNNVTVAKKELVGTDSIIQSFLAPENAKVDPCTDFARFACQGANERFDQSAGDSLIKSVDGIVRALIESDYETASNYTTIGRRAMPTGKQLFTTIKTNYHACMNVSNLAAQGLSPLKEIVHEIRSKFPVANLSSSATMSGSEPTACVGDGPDKDPMASLMPSSGNVTRDSNRSVDDVSLYLGQLSVPLFSMEATVDVSFYDPKHNALHIVPHAFGDGWPESDEDWMSYGDTISRLLQTMLPNDLTRDDQARHLGQAVAYLESKMLEISKHAEDPFESTPEQMTLDEVVALCPSLGLGGLIRGLVPASRQNSKIEVSDPATIKTLSELVSNAPAAVIQAYLIYRTARAFHGFVRAPALDAFARPEQPWVECVQQALSSGPSHMLGRMFARAAIPQKSREIGEEMMTAIKQRFVDNLDRREWISPQVKQAVKQKVANVGQYFAYRTSSPDIDSIESIAAYYSDLEMTDDYFKNNLAFRRWDVSHRFDRVGEPVDRQNTLSPTVVNAMYEPVLNSVYLNGPYLRHPFASKDYPSAINFGGTGSALGHELTHGFDSSGRKFDPNGRKVAWWDNQTIAEFEKRTKCFVRQYDAFTYPGPTGPLHVNGTQTLAENIADNGGTNLAFGAWKASARDNDMKLPGLERFTSEQLFFIANAMTDCAANRAGDDIQRISRDEHAPGLARIKGWSQNSRDFREAFNCPVKEPVCELW
ncbi:hypothetical protein XA68_14067 [Ophiocordyceps unilateralis]|uniref:Peptidase M13 C-terminal domain-containing protein n=1 Tax=Ophiocordyceps unilateralis TaxID=268505 RepID=A0A2A9PN89_OPHUN|nr:hypothetical protein XA68_14067 [Ophiocordyceps unilateralis]